MTTRLEDLKPEALVQGGLPVPGRRPGRAALVPQQ